MRTLWKGAISFGLVTIPVSLYPATRKEELKFRMLRKSDLSPNTVHLTFPRIRIAGSRLLVGPRDLRIGYPDIFRFTPLGPKRPFRCGTRI